MWSYRVKLGPLGILHWYLKSFLQQMKSQSKQHLGRLKQVCFRTSNSNMLLHNISVDWEKVRVNARESPSEETQEWRGVYREAGKSFLAVQNSSIGSLVPWLVPWSCTLKTPSKMNVALWCYKWIGQIDHQAGKVKSTGATNPLHIVWRYIVMLISCDFQNIVEILLSHFFLPYHTIFFY